VSGSRIVVVSPHLDDAVLSLGAWTAAAAARGDDVRVVTVFAGDPGSEDSPSPWDARAGFRTAGEAARARRGEDEEACSLLGAGTDWLEGTRAAPPEELGRVLAAALGDAELVLVPGFPCTHADHELVATAVAEQRLDGELAFYVDQPYATWRLLGDHQPAWRRATCAAGLAARLRSVRTLQEPTLLPALAATRGPTRWEPLPAGARERRLKREAALAYRSQFAIFGRKLIHGIALYERGWGGEGIGRLAQ
jgi:LmbE family N-acetylglucosaminyl deacetylase